MEKSAGVVVLLNQGGLHVTKSKSRGRYNDICPCPLPPDAPVDLDDLTFDVLLQHPLHRNATMVSRILSKCDLRSLLTIWHPGA